MSTESGKQHSKWLLHLPETKAWHLFDTQDYLLPHRRNRVWGLGAITGSAEVKELPKNYLSAMGHMSTSIKLPDTLLFEDAPAEELKPGRHQDLVKAAQEVYGTGNIYVDCSTSMKQLMAAKDVVPCITPSHPVYSTRLSRYLHPREFLCLQGLFPSCFTPEVYECLQQKGQDFAGNSFSSTVCQATLISSIVACPKAWAMFAKQSSGEAASTTTLKRIVGKRKAPEYDSIAKPEKKTRGGKPYRRAHKKHRRIYKRKRPETDSRKLAKGKRPQVSIAQKMEMSLDSNRGL